VEAAILVGRKSAVTGWGQQDIPPTSKVTCAEQLEELQAAVELLQVREAELQEIVAVKNAHIEEVSAWARSMERALKRSNQMPPPSLLGRARKAFMGNGRKR
jgi:hypothetical protein